MRQGNAIYHWKSQGCDILVSAISVEDARRDVGVLLSQAKWQDPERFKAMLNSVQTTDPFVAAPGHVITIDSREL